MVVQIANDIKCMQMVVVVMRAFALPVPGYMDCGPDLVWGHLMLFC